MKISTDKVYIDYLDHTLELRHQTIPPEIRLRFDLLLFFNDVLCLSVPACVKLKNTTDLLMQLTPFWSNGKIRLILDKKHGNNPWKYFTNRQYKLEQSFSEEALTTHFEYIAYQAEHTQIFYNTFLTQVANVPSTEFYIRKIYDTDLLFRHFVVDQAHLLIADIPERFKQPVQVLHACNVLNNLIMIAEDQSTLFQRSHIEHELQQKFKLYPYEELFIRRILDIGFARANGISSYAAPISSITNRLTAQRFIPIINACDPELYSQIVTLDWNGLYDLSIGALWHNLINDINRIMRFMQVKDKQIRFDKLPTSLEFSLSITKLLHSLYDSVSQSVQKGLLSIGVPPIDIANAKTFSDHAAEYILSKNEYFDTVNEISCLIPAIKMQIKSIIKEYKDDSPIIISKGFSVTKYYGKQY